MAAPPRRRGGGPPFSRKAKNKVKIFSLIVAFLPKFPLASLQRVCYK